MQTLTYKYTLPLMLAACIAAYALFALVPALDLAVTRAFYANGAFWGKGVAWLHTMRMVFWNLSLVSVLLCLIALSLGYSQNWPARLMPMRDWNVIFWGFTLGTGVLVNAILKGYSGRPRPRDVTEFGGDAVFRAVGQWDGSCTDDCSFVSGEVSGTTVFCLACMIVIQHHAPRLGPRWSMLAYLAVAASFGFVFLHRVVTGGHFLSDAIMATLLTALVVVLIARYWPQTRR
ncbi:MAG: phosphatase PAP2 family protein [Cypionkella sp.]|nr:phosphatase PAP2 family protein [Cypionkella sp.]